MIHDEVYRSTGEWSTGRMWAICFDLRQDALERYYPGKDIRNAYGDIRRVLEQHGFTNQQGSVYFGSKPNPVTCVLAVQDIQKKHSWFRAVVRDMRMLRIEENNDLMSALGQPELPLTGTDGSPRSAPRLTLISR